MSGADMATFAQAVERISHLEAIYGPVEELTEREFNYELSATEIAALREIRQLERIAGFD